MKYLTILLLFGVLPKISLGQSDHSGLHMGKYEGTDLIYFKHSSDTSSKVDRMNETWGKKTLTLNSNGTFLLEFPVPHPTTAVGLKRLAEGRWVRINDTLILNSHHPYTDFITVKERKVNGKRIKVKLNYTHKGKNYHPPLSVRINNQQEKMIDTKRKHWTYFPIDTVKTLLVEYWVGPTSTYREWVYKPINRNSNSFVISVTDSGDDVNFVVEDYKLLIVDSSLAQINQVFRLRENSFKATNFR
jgi:hypothetical protein